MSIEWVPFIRGDKILLTTPLLRWYIAHGLVVDHVYQVIEYEAKPCFQQFGDSASAARRAGDADPDKAVIADTMKLFGNSGYGKTVSNVDRHRDLHYCTEGRTSSLIYNHTISTTRSGYRQRLLSRDEQMSGQVHAATTHWVLRVPVRQTPYATVLL